MNKYLCIGASITLIIVTITYIVSVLIGIILNFDYFIMFCVAFGVPFIALLIGLVVPEDEY